MIVKIFKLKIIVIVALLFCTLNSMAQWQSNPAINTQAEVPALSYIDAPTKIISDAKGNFFVRWVQQGVSGATSLYVQKLDKRGHRVWGDKGICIDTLIGITRYNDGGLLVDSRGDLIVPTQNARINNGRQFPVIYKLDGDSGKIVWKKNIDTVWKAANDSSFVTHELYALAPLCAITPTDNVIVTWTTVDTTGRIEKSGSCMQKLNSTTGAFMWPGRVELKSENGSAVTFPQPTIVNGENFIVTWAERAMGAAASTPFNLLCQKFDVNGVKIWAHPTDVSPNNLMAPGTFPTPFNDNKGGIIIFYKATATSGAEYHVQRIDTLSGAFKAGGRWGGEALTAAKNTKYGKDVNDASIVYDPAGSGRLWYAFLHNYYGLATNRVYLQGMDLNGNFTFADTTADGKEILAAGKGSGSASANYGFINMKGTGDGLMLVYQQGDTIKATKFDYTGQKTWTMAEALGTTINVSYVKSLGYRGAVSEYNLADSQLVVALSGIPSKGGLNALVQNVKNSKVSGGSLGNGTIPQVIAFNTTPLYLTYGDAVPDLGGSSNAGILPTYVVDDPSMAYVDDDNKVHLLSSGTFNVSAVFVGNDTFVTKISLPKTVIVAKKQLRIIAENKAQKYGYPIPTLTMRFESFVNGDDVMSFTKLPTIKTFAILKSPIGEYPITLQGGISSKYEPFLVNGKLTIYPDAENTQDKLDAYYNGAGSVQVNIFSTQPQNGVLQLISLNGKVVWSGSVTVSNQFTNLQIPVFNLAPAVYVVRFAGNLSKGDQKVKIK